MLGGDGRRLRVALVGSGSTSLPRLGVSLPSPVDCGTLPVGLGLLPLHPVLVPGTTFSNFPVPLVQQKRTVKA